VKFSILIEVASNICHQNLAFYIDLLVLRG